MSQGTPRKFSEKIAILERKQNEEQEQFHSVMRDVRAITNKTPASSSNANHPCSSAGLPDGSSMTNNVTMPESPVCSPQHLSTGPTHPLSMAWNRPGGSLPNVHQMVQQQQQPTTDYTGWNYWQVHQAQGHIRTRSPGSHYHPYLNRPKQHERVPNLENHMMATNMHLQPPDASWSKARSDPTIHMNAIAAAAAAAAASSNYNPYQSQANQWSPDYRVLQNKIGPGPSSSQTPAYMAYSTGPFALNVQQFGGTQQMPSSSMPNHHPQLQQHQSLSSNSQCGGSMGDMSVGSLPNMHSSLAQNKMNFGGQQQQQTNNNQQQQQHVSQNTTVNHPHPQQQLSNTFYQQLTTPLLTSESQSQSAPTSPAQAMENIMRQNWPPTRHFSASPDTLDIPNIVLTNSDGTLDCFQDLQDLHLDNEISNEIQQLLSNPNEQSLDPALETQLLN